MKKRLKKNILFFLSFVQISIIIVILAFSGTLAYQNTYFFNAKEIDNNLKNKAFESCSLSLEPDSFPIYHNNPQKRSSNFYLTDFFHHLNSNYIVEAMLPHYESYFNKFKTYKTDKRLELVYDKKGNLLFFIKKTHLDRNKYGFCFYNPFNDLFAVAYGDYDTMFTHYKVFDTGGRLIYSCESGKCNGMFLIPRIMYFFENF